MTSKDPIQEAMEAGVSDLTLDKNGHKAKRPTSYTRCTIPQRRDSVRTSLGSGTSEDAKSHDSTVETAEEEKVNLKEVCR